MYRSVDELPLKTLFKIFETDDLTLLNPTEGTTEEELKEVWLGIKEEYSELDTSNTIKRVVRVSQKIDYFKAKHEMVSLCVYLLRFERNAELEKRLADAGYKVNPEDYESSLEKIEIDAKGLQVRVGAKEAELERLTKDDSIAKSDINKMLASMSSALGIAFKFNEITVVEFFGYKNALEEKAKQQQKNKRHGRRKN